MRSSIVLEKLLLFALREWLRRHSNNVDGGDRHGTYRSAPLAASHSRCGAICILHRQAVYDAVLRHFPRGQKNSLLLPLPPCDKLTPCRRLMRIPKWIEKSCSHKRAMQLLESSNEHIFPLVESASNPSLLGAVHRSDIEKAVEKCERAMLVAETMRENAAAEAEVERRRASSLASRIRMLRGETPQRRSSSGSPADRNPAARRAGEDSACPCWMLAPTAHQTQKIPPRPRPSRFQICPYGFRRLITLEDAESFVPHLLPSKVAKKYPWSPRH